MKQWAVEVYSYNSACSLKWLNWLSGAVNVYLTVTDVFTHWHSLIYSQLLNLYSTNHLSAHL